MEIKRGEIYFVCLDPVFGREMGGFKMRPVVVVSINDINRNTRLITVVPGTDAEHETRPFQNIVRVDPNKDVVKLDPNKDLGLGKATNFQCHQVRAVEQGRFTQRARGRISRDKLQQIEKAIGFCLGLNLEK